jgi:hypothetical protein
VIVNYLSTLTYKAKGGLITGGIFLWSVKNEEEKEKVLFVWKKYGNKYHTTQTLISTFNLELDVKDLRESFIRWKWQGRTSAIPLDAEEEYYRRVNNPLHPWYYIKTGRKFLRRPSASGCAKFLALVIGAFGLLLNDKIIQWIKQAVRWLTD